MLPKRNIGAIITCLAAIVTGTVIIIFPLGYFYISYLDMASGLKAEAEINGEIIKKIISENPEYWQFQTVRLSEYLARHPRNGVAELRRIVNNNNEIVAESTEPLVFPIMSRSHKIMDSGVVVGKVEISRSLRPLLKDSALIALVVLPFGLGTFIILRIFPIRTIGRIESALRKAHEELEKKVEERTIELTETNYKLRVEVQQHGLTYEALRRSEEQHRALIEASTDAIITTNKDMKIIQWNSAASKIFGYGKEEVINKSADILVPEKLMDSYLRTFNQVSKSGSTDLSEIFRNTISFEGRTKNGLSVPIEFSISAYRSVETLSFTFIIRDITARNNSEQKRMELEARLQRAEKMEAMGILAGGVAHDLNNVLGVVIGYSQLLLINEEINASTKLEKKITTIMKSAERAAAIVQDMLTLARRGVHTKKVINMNTTIMEYQNTPEYHKLLSFHPDVRVKTFLESDLPNVTGSPVHFSKTIMNLVSNAAEAMPNGGMISITTSHKYVDTAIQGYEEIHEGNYVIVTISDTGDGISDEDIKHIFEPFYTKKIMGKSGTGLGLSVVWGTVKDYNGYIDVHSDTGEGSTFYLFFPATNESVTCDDIRVTESEYMGSGESIMVVDDIKEQREMAAGILDGLNYNVILVPSGEEAIAYLKNGEKADLIVLDMIMDPGMDGLDTYSQILGINEKQRAIIVSGFSETERVSEAIKLGVSSYVQKPYKTERLGMAIKNSLMR